MITKPDLLFRKNIEEIVKEKIQLSYIERVERQKAFLKYSDDAAVQLNKELISNFSPNVVTFKPINFPKDLGLDVLIRDFLQPNHSASFQLYNLSRPPVDIPTINYRWNILDEIIEKTELMGQLNLVSEQLSVVFKRLNEYRNMSNYEHFSKNRSRQKLEFLNIPLLTEYVESVNVLAKITKDSNSDGFNLIFDYSIKLIESEEFKILSEFLSDYNNDQYVELGVTLNSINDISKVKYLGVEKNKINRGILKELSAKFKILHFSEHLNDNYSNSYEGLLVMVSNGLIEESMKQIEQTTYLIGDIEFYNSAARLRDIFLKNKLPATRPKIKDMKERKHSIKNMFSPLINYHSNPCSGKVIYESKITPNDYLSDPDSNIRLVTGPNNGGKTRATTGFGLVFALGQSGFYVPAEEAEISLIDNIYTHFVFGDNADNESGRWVNEISRMDEMLYHMTPYSLSLIDDFGSGTNYQEAREPALNVIYGHHKLGTTLLMNTHLHQLAEDVEQGEFPEVSNWQVEAYVKNDHLIFTHRIIPERAGQSYAQLIAESYGLSRKGIDLVIKKRIEQGELDSNQLR